MSAARSLLAAPPLLNVPAAAPAAGSSTFVVTGSGSPFRLAMPEAFGCKAYAIGPWLSGCLFRRGCFAIDPQNMLMVVGMALGQRHKRNFFTFYTNRHVGSYGEQLPRCSSLPEYFTQTSECVFSFCAAGSSSSLSILYRALSSSTVSWKSDFLGLIAVTLANHPFELEHTAEKHSMGGRSMGRKQSAILV